MYNKKIIFLIILIFSLSSCSNKVEEKVIKSYSSEFVQTGSIDNFNSYVGYISGNKEIFLSAKSPGRITFLEKNIGDEVKKGELLSTLDGIEAKTGYANANNIVEGLKDLKEQTSKTFDAQIKSAEAKIEQVKLGIDGLGIGLEDTKNISDSQLITAKKGIEQAKLGVETAKTNLEETKKTLEQNKKNIISGGESAITQSVILYKNIINFSDKLLGITNNNKRYNDSFDDYLGKKDSNQLKKSKTLFLENQKLFDEYEKYYNEKIENKEASQEEIIAGLKIAKKVAESLKIFLKELYTTTDNSIANVNFSIYTIEGYKKNISDFGVNVEKSLMTVEGNYSLGIKASLENLQNLEVNRTKAISLLEKQVELAKASLETAEKTYEQYENISKGQINGVETKQKITNKQLEEAQSGLEALKEQKKSSLKEIETKIIEAQGGKNTASVMIDNGKVFSNIDGIITQKFAEKGQVINAGMPIYKVVENNLLKIKTSINLIDYKKIKIGDKVDLKIEGLGKDIEGKITSINEYANNFTKKYDIEIEIDNKKGEIPLGAMTKIIIKKDNLSDNISTNIVIPNEAIISDFMIPSVFVIENNKAILKNIEIIKMGENFSEVKGINSGEKIITKGKENIWDGEILK